MKWFCLIPIASLALVSCSKKANGPASSASQLTNATAQAAQAQQALDGVPDPNLTAALRAFVREKGRMPQSMVELKATKLDSLPRAPAGFMYAIDPVTVEVKLVKQ